MRFREFGLLNESKSLFEYDQSMSDEELKDLIIKRLKTEQDREMLDRIFQTLEQSTLDERIAGALSKDEDANSKLKVFAGMVLNTEGSYEEKNKFIENYNEGYIDVDKLITPNQVVSFSDWIIGDDFVNRVFENLYGYTPQGIGPGEYALAILSPRIKSAGRLGDVSGDLLIDKTAVEVKAKQVAGGRFTDNRKAKMDQRGVENAFKEIGIDPGKGISAKQWATQVREQVPQENMEKLVSTIIKGAFAFVDKQEAAKLKDALINGDANQIKHEWGILSFYNYRKMSGFDTMLLLDGPKGKSLYFEDAEAVTGILKAGQPNIVGPEQQVHPQMAFKI